MRIGSLLLGLSLIVGWPVLSAHAEEAAPAVSSPPALKGLSVLYAGDPESPRTERFTAFLSPWVQRVEAISLKDLDAEAAAKFDVVVADWHRRYGEDGYQGGEAHGMQLERDFKKPVVMVGAVGGELVRGWSKLNWL